MRKKTRIVGVYPRVREVPIPRDRQQLVISLGEGDEGRRVREALQKAANGQQLSVWARELLMAAADPADLPRTVESRLRALEMMVFEKSGLCDR